jgi:hypothetical protein
MRLSTTRGRVENEEIVIHVFVNLHNTCLISTSVAVIWRRKDCHDMFIMTPVVAAHHKLMCARY